MGFRRIVAVLACTLAVSASAAASTDVTVPAVDDPTVVESVPAQEPSVGPDHDAGRPILLGLLAALFLVMGAIVADKHRKHGGPKSRRLG